MFWIRNAEFFTHNDIWTRTPLFAKWIMFCWVSSCLDCWGFEFLMIIKMFLVWNKTIQISSVLCSNKTDRWAWLTFRAQNVNNAMSHSRMTIGKYIAAVSQQLTTLLNALGAPNGLITRGISRYASVLNDSFLHYKQLTRTLPYSQHIVGFPIYNKRSYQQLFENWAIQFPSVCSSIPSMIGIYPIVNQNWVYSVVLWYKLLKKSWWHSIQLWVEAHTILSG